MPMVSPQSAQIASSLPVTGMTTQQLENIQKTARKGSLGKMRFNQEFPLVVVYGTKLTGGIEMVYLTMEQGTRAVEHFLYHKYTNDEVSRLMDLSLRISQLESGQTEPLSMSPKIPVPYLSMTW